MLFETKASDTSREQLIFLNKKEKGGSGQNPLLGPGFADIDIITRKLF